MTGIVPELTQKKMMGWDMIGVVLWSDTQQKKAVIWCEDHGDLAFYREQDPVADVTFDPGDLVQFELTTERHLRFAHNPRLVSEREYAPLPNDLKDAAEPATGTRYARASAEIIPFAAAAELRKGSCQKVMASAAC
jgi:hypothetical protein